MENVELVIGIEIVTHRIFYSHAYEIYRCVEELSVDLNE